ADPVTGRDGRGHSGSDSPCRRSGHAWSARSAGRSAPTGGRNWQERRQRESLIRANHSSLITITAIGFPNPGRRIENATAAVKANVARLEAEVHELKDLLAKVCAQLGAHRRRKGRAARGGNRDSTNRDALLRTCFMV